MATYSTKVDVVAKNEKRNLIFFEDKALVYNYKTDQWSRATGYSGLGFFTLNSLNDDIGLIRTSSGSVDLQNQALTDDALDATIETASDDKTTGGRTVITGVRPLVNGGTVTVQVGVQDNLDDSVSYSTAASPNSRSNTANFRDLSNTEGRYVRTRYSISGGFTTAQGADIEYHKSGDV